MCLTMLKCTQHGNSGVQHAEVLLDCADSSVSSLVVSVHAGCVVTVDGELVDQK